MPSFSTDVFFFVSAWHQRRRALRGIDFTGLESDDRMNFSAGAVPKEGARIGSGAASDGEV